VDLRSRRCWRRIAAAETFADAEVLDWRTLAPEMVTLVRITDLAGTLVLVLVFIAAAAGVANTMVMATFERARTAYCSREPQLASRTRRR
jgi:ABC-type lipoprotein release transport system permease subunit